MGFRCIKCNRDFGRDKASFSKHFVTCTGVSTSAFEKEVMDNSESVTQVIALKGKTSDIVAKLKTMLDNKSEVEDE